MRAQDILEKQKEIVAALKGVFDPEIPVNIYDLGLIYDIDYEPSGMVHIEMTLTAPNCPMADQLLEDVKSAASGVEGVSEVEVTLVFEPVWDKSKMSEEALLELGMF
ncbi:MAG: iron-sulfur cluster assembly protein [Rikenellaceae bacterium]